MSVFPNEIDSDVEIPRIDNNVSEIGADTINSLRDAVFQGLSGFDASGICDRPPAVHHRRIPRRWDDPGFQRGIENPRAHVLGRGRDRSRRNLRSRCGQYRVR